MLSSSASPPHLSRLDSITTLNLLYTTPANDNDLGMLVEERSTQNENTIHAVLILALYIRQTLAFKCLAGRAQIPNT